jgi:large subunit ribosomal protein L33
VLFKEGAHVAQLVEHFLGKGEVTGSIPVAGSRLKRHSFRGFASHWKIMAKNRTIIKLECGECKMRNYSKLVSKKRVFAKLELSKYCSKCRKHQAHKETK